jgi:hypothetical protein
MRIRNLWQLPAVALLALSVQGGCVLVPEIVDRLVELAVTGTVTKELTSAGSVNTHDDRDTVDVRGDLKLAAVLEDAGIDVSDVKSVTVQGATYLTTKPDPEPLRAIQNGTVTIERIAGGGEQTLISNFNAVVNGVTTETTAPLQAPGVGVVNTLLQQLLDEVKNGTPGSAGDTRIVYHVTGTSVPGNVATNFKWRLKLLVNVVGTIDVSIPE